MIYSYLKIYQNNNQNSFAGTIAFIRIYVVYTQNDPWWWGLDSHQSCYSSCFENNTSIVLQATYSNELLEVNKIVVIMACLWRCELVMDLLNPWDNPSLLCQCSMMSTKCWSMFQTAARRGFITDKIKMEQTSNQYVNSWNSLHQFYWGGWGCEVSCDGHHRPRGKTTTESALDGAVFDIAQILAYLVHNMSRSQLYLGFGHFGWLPSFFGQ